MMTTTREKILFVLPILLAGMSWASFAPLAAILFDIFDNLIIAWALISISLLSYSFFCWIFLNKVQQLLDKSVAEGHEPVKLNGLRNTLILMGVFGLLVTVITVFGA